MKNSPFGFSIFGKNYFSVIHGFITVPLLVPAGLAVETSEQSGHRWRGSGSSKKVKKCFLFVFLLERNRFSE
jgi:hypothetical protein